MICFKNCLMLMWSVNDSMPMSYIHFRHNLCARLTKNTILQQRINKEFSLIIGEIIACSCLMKALKKGYGKETYFAISLHNSAQYWISTCRKSNSNPILIPICRIYIHDLKIDSQAILHCCGKLLFQ